MVHFVQVFATILIAVQLGESRRGVVYYKEDDLGDSACSGQPNLIPPWTGQPTFVRQIENGTLYTAGDGEDMIYGMLTRHTVTRRHFGDNTKL